MVNLKKMKNEFKTYWICLHNWVHVSIKTDAVLLYNTRNGQFIITKNPKQIDLINQLHERKNLGTTLIDDIILQDADLKTFIEEAQQKEIFSLIEYRENFPRPIQLMPVLNIQRDIEKIKKEKDRSIGEEIIYYLTELTLFVNNQCGLQCSFCNDAVKQFLCCSSQNNTKYLDVSVLQSIAKQIKILQGLKLNIIGGNIFQYPEIKQIPAIFPENKIYYWFHYSNFQSNIIDFSSQFDVLVDFPLKKEILTACKNQLPKETTQFHFIVSSVENITTARSLIDEFSIENFEFHPFYTGMNNKFFEENVYLNEEDITSETINQRKIFCNQALNANFFGKLTILPNCDVYANINAEKLGNIKDNSLLQLIYKELDINTSWRKTRNQKPCSNCVFQYLCPAPSNYEISVGRQNLCHLI